MHAVIIPQAFGVKAITGSGQVAANALQYAL